MRYPRYCSISNSHMAQRNYFSCIRTFVGERALVLDGSLDGSTAAQLTLLVVKAQGTVVVLHRSKSGKHSSVCY